MTIISDSSEAAEGPARAHGAERPAARERRPNAQALVRTLREEIISAALPPGARLTEEGLAERFGVSRVPVREALRTLEAEGFVQSRPYAGMVVAELSAQEAEDLLEVRALLEPLAADRAARRRSAQDVGRLEELLSLAEDARAAGRLDELARLNSRFHQVLAQASGSSTLAQLVTQLGQKISWVYSLDLPRRADDSWAEHARIVAAIADQDARTARSLVAAHIGQAQSAYRLRHSTDEA